MNYQPELIKKLLAELEKVPNIRYVCNKVGIDHSTFYRWMGAHAEFHKSVALALTLGREKMDDAAEGVIISGIQNNNFQCAKYWLSHNNERYIGIERVSYFQYLERNNLEFLKGEGIDDPLTIKVFEHCLRLEKSNESKIAEKKMEEFIHTFCNGNPNLMDSFRTNYKKWKKWI